MRRNLAMTHRYLNPVINQAAGAVLARRRATLAEAVGRVAAKDPTLSVDADEARRVAVRFVFDEAVAKDRLRWVAGVPTKADLATVTRRVCANLGLTAEEVADALRGHPMPQTIG